MEVCELCVGAWHARVCSVLNPFLRHMRHAHTYVQGDVLFAVVLAGYADQLLKSESKGATAAGPVQALSEAEIESKLDSVVGLLTYVKDKDIFGEAYRRLLSTRLMNNRSASDEMEKVMVGKLKMKCGSSFTYHMESALACAVLLLLLLLLTPFWLVVAACCLLSAVCCLLQAC